MHAAGHPYDLLSAVEMDCIHRNVLRILAEVGIEIQNERLLADLAGFGLQVDLAAQRVRFPAPVVERFLADARKDSPPAHPRQVSGSAGIYHGKFHDPQSNQLVDWTEDDLAYYMALAARPGPIKGASMLGSRIGGDAALEPLHERLYCWKYGAEEGGSIYLDELCPYLFEIYQMRSDWLGKPIQEVFRGAVYLVPPLKLGRHEAFQVQYFRERGLHVPIGDMYALGANAPVTLAGGLALNIAEQIALRILDWAWFGLQNLHIGGSISVIDMRTLIYPYGRPEMAVVNLMLAQMARYYGASFHGHAGLSDAKLPSVESGYQKALTGIPNLLATGSLWMDAGLLSIDEVCSPVQLLLDAEFLSALQRFTVEFEINDEAIGLETIKAVGPGGSFLDQEHTVRRMRREHWQPALWSREMLSPWLEGSRALDVDKARAQALDFRASFQARSALSEAQERDLQALIQRAAAHMEAGVE
ncbi:MAG: trimethylamine methyltransferase family protein [Anaerolineae bacterium]|nr:trimethylamine methyltransferase family protein [Anaerolineae bacterium]